jgi:hypothetical protein
MQRSSFLGQRADMDASASEIAQGSSPGDAVALWGLLD